MGRDQTARYGQSARLMEGPNPWMLARFTLAPPFDRRKERFRWQDTDMIRGEESFEGAVLDAFTTAIKQAQRGASLTEWHHSIPFQVCDLFVRTKTTCSLGARHRLRSS